MGKPNECNYKYFISAIAMCNLLRMPCGKVQHCPMEKPEFKTIRENKE